MGVNCATCGHPIEDTWVEVIVRDEMLDEFIHAVGFLCNSICLLRYAEQVIKNEAE